MLHLCSGQMGYQAWSRTGLAGAAAIWEDSPAVGPWSPAPELRRRLRAQFWGLPEARVADPELAALAALDRAEAVALWFSEEPWDQLAQLWVVALLHGRESGRRPRLETVPMRLGGCEVPPAALLKAFEHRRLLTEGDQAQAARLWDRFQAEDWPWLWEWHRSSHGLPGLPRLAQALTRVLEDRPPYEPGRTERQVRDLMAGGIHDLPTMMRALAEREEPYGVAWYGDQVVARLLAGPAGP